MMLDLTLNIDGQGYAARARSGDRWDVLPLGAGPGADALCTVYLYHTNALLPVYTVEPWPVHRRDAPPPVQFTSITAAATVLLRAQAARAAEAQFVAAITGAA